MMELVCALIVGATGIKHLTINVPSMVRSGDTVMLSCNYDLEGASLYRVMWYFGQDEFYRYVLERSEPCITFPVDGIQVNLSKSNMYDVVLVDVSRKLTGPYKCEVSAGSPTYHTLIAIANMEVVDAPKTDPTIGIEKQRMTMGESLSANCSSGSSRPASNITWKLNGASISNGNKFRIRSNVIPDVNDTKITRSHVEFKVTNDMFDHGRIRLTCTASISSVYRKSVESEVLEDTTPLIASITGDASPHSHQSSGCGRCNLGTASGVILATTLSLTRLASLMTTMTLPVSSCRACR
ncbi:uncharacterized protein [Prorops nasuta]|uniref:uncharacterized protein isoform X2 n=1 Tax=Prorops nasuta TaxID=863751 RepID=UPI0034CDA077